MKKLPFIFVLLLCLIIFIFDKFKRVSLIEFDTQMIKVTVSGEVTNPGIFEVELNTTLEKLFDSLAFTEVADLSSFNQQLLLKSNDYIIIPKKGHYLISINYGTYDQLLTVKGIGPVLANKIISYRTDVGLFQNLEDLKLIKGIKEKTFEKIKDYLCL